MDYSHTHNTKQLEDSCLSLKFFFSCVCMGEWQCVYATYMEVALEVRESYLWSVVSAPTSMPQSELQLSEQTVHALDHWAISLAQSRESYKHYVKWQKTFSSYSIPYDSIHLTLSRSYNYSDREYPQMLGMGFGGITKG